MCSMLKVKFWDGPEKGTILFIKAMDYHSINAKFQKNLVLHEQNIWLNVKKKFSVKLFSSFQFNVSDMIES